MIIVPHGTINKSPFSSTNFASGSFKKCFYSFASDSCLGNSHANSHFEKALFFKTYYKTVELQLQQRSRSCFHHVFLRLEYLGKKVKNSIFC